jgi:hypothetical protein
LKTHCACGKHNDYHATDISENTKGNIVLNDVVQRESTQVKFPLFEKTPRGEGRSESVWNSAAQSMEMCRHTFDVMTAAFQGLPIADPLY